MLRTFTCIMCPRGCGLEALLEPVCASGTGSCADGSEPVYVIRQVTGNGCQKGEQYVRQEIENPMRNIATSILVDGGDLPLASVRLTAPVPKGRIFDVMEKIRQVRRKAPVNEGDVVIADVLGLGVDVIVTRTVEKA